MPLDTTDVPTRLLEISRPCHSRVTRRVASQFCKTSLFGYAQARSCRNGKTDLPPYRVERGLALEERSISARESPDQGRGAPSQRILSPAQGYADSLPAPTTGRISGVFQVRL